MHKILLTDNPHPASLEVLRRYPEISSDIVGTLDKERLKAALCDCDAVIVRSPTRLTADVIAAASKLRYIGRAGAGCDNIDLAEAARRGIVVMNSPAGNTIATAEHTIALMLACARRIPQAHRSMVEGRWDRPQFKGTELCGKTAGIIGLGRVGAEVARRLLAFSMRVIATDPFATSDRQAPPGVELVGLETLLGGSDFITVHVPLDESTRSLVSAAEIAKMRDGVYLVNCARGGIVDEEAVIQALDGGKIAAVAFDVFEHEPPGSSPLLKHPKSVFTPHIGGATAESGRRVAMEIAEVIADALVNSTLRNVVRGS
ncbi:MAG: hypothetical protein HY770_04075 [Chitinivibrionia bacterium]|nr:hypothetical protein [Chitinivibrionia bacterium]